MDVSGQKEGRHQWCRPSFFLSKKETFGAASSLPVLQHVVDLQLVESVVYHGYVYGAESHKCNASYDTVPDWVNAVLAFLALLTAVLLIATASSLFSRVKSRL